MPSNVDASGILTGLPVIEALVTADTMSRLQIQEIIIATEMELPVIRGSGSTPTTGRAENARTARPSQMIEEWDTRTRQPRFYRLGYVALGMSVVTVGMLSL